MNSFANEYIDLLERQVREEIGFLQSHGHKNTDNFPSCMFCYNNSRDTYSCNRLGELRNFLSNLAVSRNKDRADKRIKIGYEVNDVSHLACNAELPKLLQPL